MEEREDREEREWDMRPLSVQQARGWQTQQHGPGPSTSGAAAPPTAFAGASAAQRRRSSAVHVPPPAPPPDQPIPNVPIPPSQPYDMRDGSETFTDQYYPQADRGYSYGRPAPSASLAAVANFPVQTQSQFQPRQLTAPHDLQRSASVGASSSENLSDPPPRSLLHSASSQELSQHNSIVPDRLLLSPPEPRAAETRPSPRRALTRALELAREAVKLDATNDDPQGAVVAYGRSVALLSEVMERVRRGEDSTMEPSRRRNGRRRSVVAQEEEVRRLKSIHDTYADRMNILSVIYSIPAVPLSPSSVYTATMSVSTDSSTPTQSSPSSSPSSDSESDRPQPPINHAQAQERLNHDDYSRDDGMEAIGTAMIDIDNLVNSSMASQSPPRNPPSPKAPSSFHPYAAASSSSSTRSRSSSIVGRPRASSALPPLAPPPMNSPPPAPAPIITEPPIEPDLSQTPMPVPGVVPAPAATTRHLDVVGRPRGNSTGHKRTGSGSRLVALQEEAQDDRFASQQRQPVTELDTYSDGHGSLAETPRNGHRDEHPLPPLPSPSNSSGSSVPGTPRTLVHNKSAPSSQIMPRPRGTSTVSTRSDSSTSQPQPLISTTTAAGTISQRRSKMSTPPVSGSPPPDLANAGRVTPQGLPAATASTVVVGRARASSQPGRRPSVVNGRVSPMDNRPPIPQTAGTNGTNVPRKPSFPSKLNPSVQIPPQLVIQTELSPTGSIPAMPANALVPPPPMAVANLPTTPTSPLPPLAPTDTLRKPYHMMNLLRATMTSKTGGYVTRRLHVPQEVWSQGGAKLQNLAEKVRVVEVLCSALEDVQNASVEYFGAGNVSSGMALGIGSIGKKEGEQWIAKLEEFSSMCDGLVANVGKKLGVGEGFVIKKSSGVTAWGGILSRRIDKLTNGKNLDSPAAYVAGLSRLFASAQLLDEHTRALLTQPVAPAYAAFPPDVRAAAEAKLKRVSEFFASVVLTFVIRDLSQLLDKYVRKCEKWLVE